MNGNNINSIGNNNGTMGMQVFNNEEFGQIRTVVIDNEPWMVGKDVASALGYAKPENAIANHVDGEDKTATLIQGSGSNYKTKAVIINESGLYSLVMSSKLPGAKKFRRWVTSEVLPTLRKTGEYAMICKPDSYMISDPVERAKCWIEEEQERQRLANTIEEQKPLVEFADKVSNTKDCIDMGQMAKLLKDEHINIGRNRLFSWLRDNGYLMKNNIPYQKHIESGLFVVKEIVKDTIYGDKVFTTTYVTGKGQIHIAAKVKEKFGVSKVKS